VQDRSASASPATLPTPRPEGAADAQARSPVALARRFALEVRDAVEATSPRRLLWSTAGRLLPDFTFPGTRTFALRWMGCEIADTASVLGHVNIIGPRHAARRLRIAPGCIIGPNVTFGLDGDITLERNVAVGPGATLYTGTHGLGFGSRRMSPRRSAKPIVVEEGAWIGMLALILPGVRLGAGCVVSGGAIVTRDVPPNVLVAGNPATVVETLPFGNR